MKAPLDLILLIDDDEDDNIFHSYVIKKAKVATQVDHVYDGSEALEYLMRTGRYAQRIDQVQPNLIFLDINMPGMDGWEFIEAYTSLPVHQQAKVVVVMLTTSLNPDDLKRAKEKQDVDEFLNKPLSEEALLKIIKTYFPERF